MHTVVRRFSRLNAKIQRIVAQIQVGVQGVDPVLYSECELRSSESAARVFAVKRNPVYLDSGSRSDPISFRASEVNPKPKRDSLLGRRTVPFDSYHFNDFVNVHSSKFLLYENRSHRSKPVNPIRQRLSALGAK
jgi:hypothetical protein